MKKIALTVGLVLALSVGQASALVVTQTDDASTLVSTILGPGISVISSSYTGASVASGTFTDGLSSGIGIESGIILTSGDASLAVGPNSSDSITGDNGLDGTDYLDDLLNDGKPDDVDPYWTEDATILEFTFESTGGDFFFNYVFASDEYNEYANTMFNDVFGFFLDGTDVSDNVALIPGTTTPVSINNVNGGNAQNLPPDDAAVNPEYYNDNDRFEGYGGDFDDPFQYDPDFNPPPPPAPYDIEYDGFTDLFQVEVLGLSAGEHTITLAIADAGDHVLDSAVFIQGESVSDEPVDPQKPDDIPEPATFALLGLGIAAMAIRKSRKQA